MSSYDDYGLGRDTRCSHQTKWKSLVLIMLYLSSEVKKLSVTWVNHDVEVYPSSPVSHPTALLQQKEDVG